MTASRLEKYRKDLDALVAEAFWVEQSLALMYTDRDKYVADLTNSLKGDGEKVAVFMKKIQPFPTAYQEWYSEAVTLVRQLMPDRLNDFIKLYEKPKARKEVSAESYRIEDACQGLSASFAGVVRVDAKAASVLLRQQVAIVNAIKRRFESSLFEIKQLVQADVFDDELDSARSLLKNGYTRAAGAVAGVVLEGHLKELAAKHNLPKTAKTINPINIALKAADVIDLAQSRHIDFLGDIRNKCGHKNASEPTPGEVEDLIAGVEKVIKTIF